MNKLNRTVPFLPSPSHEWCIGDTGTLQMSIRTDIQRVKQNKNPLQRQLGTDYIIILVIA